MNKAELIENIMRWQDQINDKLHRGYHEVAKKYGLSLEQFHLLIELDDLNMKFDDREISPSVGELADKTDRSHNTISEKITRLEDMELVYRKKDEKDRRIKRICLTDKAKEMLKELSYHARKNVLEKALLTFREKELSELETLLKEFYERIE